METREIDIDANKPVNQIIYGVSIASIVLSLLTVRKNPPLANFFGLWAPTALGLGIMFKENRLLDLQQKQKRTAVGAV
jgi:hypothetical protein